jgi:hypothetical protein
MLQRLEVIRHRWAEAAGEYVAQHVVPVRLVKKSLRVAADDSSWINEMTYMKDTILERLQELLGGKWVDEIHVVAGECHNPLPAKEPPFKLGQITKDMDKQAEEVGQDLADRDLAEAIKRARLAQLRRNE